LYDQKRISLMKSLRNGMRAALMKWSAGEVDYLT